MTVAFFDLALLARLPGRAIEPAVRSGDVTLCDRLSNPLIEVDAVVHKDLPPECVCDGHSLHTRSAYATQTIDDRRKER